MHSHHYLYKCSRGEGNEFLRKRRREAERVNIDIFRYCMDVPERIH